MKSRLAIICLLLFLVCTLSTVAAEDLNETQAITEESIESDDALEQVNDEVITADNSSDLQNVINSAPEGSSQKLTQNYAPQKNINVEKTITIDGAGHTIDTGNGKIEMSKGTVTLKNIIFTNGNSNSAISIFGTAKCIIDNCTFKDGEDTAVLNNAYTTLTISNSRFIHNSAKVSGGAIYTKGMLIVENSTFINNTSFNDGGAIYSQETVELKNCIFSSNRASGERGIHGGAIYSTGKVCVENSTFSDNHAQSVGGVIYANANVVIEKSTFLRNTAGNNGGAIRVINDFTVSIEHSIFINNTASGSGGAVVSSKWAHVDNSIFKGNKADGNGGAMKTDFLQMGENVTFINNYAKDNGGAIYTKTIGTVIKNITMEGNHVDADFGGGLYIESKNQPVNFYYCVFTNNYALKGDGGAVHSDSGSTNLNFYNCTFTANYATGGKERRYGGAVRSNANIYVENSTFKDNWAENYGGAIYAETASEIKNSVFISNHVKNGGKRDGGAIYINKACTIVLNGNYFERNGGAERGGAVYTDSKDARLNLINNAFIENSAGQGCSVFNSGHYDNIADNWWGANGVGIGNQLKEYHTIGSNEDHNDGYPNIVSVADIKTAYLNVKTPVSVYFKYNVNSYVSDHINYTTDKRGTFEKKVTGKSLELTYIPNETGVHTLNFTINSQKLSVKLNVTYISVYGYDFTKSFGDNSLYSATFKDKNGSYLPKGTQVMFAVNNTNYTTTVEDNGVAKLYATLDVGNYTVKAINRITGESFTNKLTILPAPKEFNIGDVYIIKLKGVVNKTISYKLGGKTHNTTTSRYGVAYIPLNVKAGNYTLEISYNGKVFKDSFKVKNSYNSVDLKLIGTSYGSMLPIYSNETFTKASNGSMYSVLGENTYRYILGSKQAFILYNVTVSNSEELTNVLRKIASADFKVDVITITLKKNTYKITESFWRDSEWDYLIHLTHGKIYIDGNGSTIYDDYHHNFICLEQDSSIYVKNIVFKKFYRVFANGGKVSCTNVAFIENNAKFFATKTPGSVIYNKDTATFENCIFDNNKNNDHNWGHGENTLGGVLYGDAGSETNFINCKFLSEDDNIRAVNESMVIIYDDNMDAYNKLVKNSNFEVFSSVDVRKLSSYKKNQTINFNIASSSDLLNTAKVDNSTIFGLFFTSNEGSSYNITLKKGEYSINADDLDKLTRDNEWRAHYKDPGTISYTLYDSYLFTVKSKPVVVNGNGATIKLTGNSISDDVHFAYIPEHGSLTLINLTISGFNTAFHNYGTLILINCTFDNNKIHHKIMDWDYGGVMKNHGEVFCYNSTFSNNAANLGGVYYSESAESSAVFSNCTFTNNLIKSNLVWNNNNENVFHIKEGIVKLVHCTGVSTANIRTDKEGKAFFRASLNNSVYTITVDSMVSLMKLSALVKENTEYDIFNVTFAKGEYGVFPNSEVLFNMEYGLMVINGGGAKVFVQNAHDSDETQFLKTSSISNVHINNLTIEGFNIAIENNGKLKIMNSHLNNNKVDYKFKSDYGGAIVNGGLLSILNTTFSNNTAKYGGAVYNTGASKFIDCSFENNNGYSDDKKIDIYNKEGSVEIIVVNSGNPNLYEKHPMAQWKYELITGGMKLATLAVTATIGWGIAVSEISCAAVLSTTINAIVGGGFGAITGYIYSNDHQDYSSFLASIIEGVGSGMDFTDLGEAAHELRPLLDQELVKGGLTQVYTLFRSKTVALGKTLAEEHEHEANFKDINAYVFFNDEKS